MIFFFLLWTALFAKEMELFVYWNPHVKGVEVFQGNSLEGDIGRRLGEAGWKIKSWEPEEYRPALTGWQGVRSWQDLKRRLGYKEGGGTADVWVFWNFQKEMFDLDLRLAERKELVLFIWEPPVVQPEGWEGKRWQHFGKIFTWDDDLVDGKRFFKFHYPVLRERIADVVDFEKKKLCTMVASRLSSKHLKELYSERERTIRFFEDKEFDLYGRYWAKRKFKNYRGTIDDKIGTIKNYKFAICYENMRDVRGYVTEKIFDCFAAGCVPVYWGASNISEYVPEECFIDRRKFDDMDALYRFLKEMGKEEYEDYLEAAARFLKSEKAKVFSQEHFIETFMAIIGPE